jgi:hypothetical protein
MRELEFRLTSEENRRTQNLRAIESSTQETVVERALSPPPSPPQARAARSERHVTETLTRTTRGQQEHASVPNEQGWVTVRHVRRVHRRGDGHKRHAQKHSSHHELYDRSVREVS